MKKNKGSQTTTNTELDKKIRQTKAICAEHGTSQLVTL